MLYTKEIWKDVVGYNGVYEISNLGHIRSTDRVIMRKGSPSKLSGKRLKTHLVQGYETVTLHKNGKRKPEYIHRLVLIAFGERVPGKNTVNHIDGNKLNNKIDNLEWCTIAENNAHAIRMGLRSDNLDKFVEYRESRKRDICAVINNTEYVAKGPKRLGQLLKTLGIFVDIPDDVLASRLSHAANGRHHYRGIEVYYI